jgi:hypothetical protein
MAVAEKTIEAIASDQVKPHEFLQKSEESAFYEVTLQLGQETTWAPEDKMYKGRKRKVKATAPGEFEHIHDPVVITPDESFTGATVNGLLSGHNEWLKKYKARENFGEPDYQLLVLDVRKTDKVPKRHQNAITNGMVSVHMIESIVRGIVTESQKPSSRSGK